MRIVLAEDSRREAWNGFVAGHSMGTPYHRWEWLESVRRAYGFSMYPLMALREMQPVGILPLVRIRPPGFRGTLISLPYCDCGGPLAEDEATCQRLVEHALDMAGQIGASGLEIRREAPLPAPSEKVLMRLALPESAERLLGAFPSKLRSQVKKPLHAGLRAVTGGMGLLTSFYWVFSRNMRDLGSPIHSRTWFQEILRNYEDTAHVTIVFLPDGSPAAGAVWLIQGNRAFNPWASSLKQYSRQCPNMLLYWSMLSQAADTGLSEFDMGRSTVDGGTYRFKRQWGAREQGLCWQRFDSVTRRARSVLTDQGPTRSRRLLANCWKRLPVVMANAVGPRIRQYISL